MARTNWRMTDNCSELLIRHKSFRKSFYSPLAINAFMPFQLKETSSINATGSGGYTKNHNEVTDAMESAVNHLADGSIGDTVTITHTIELKRTQ